MKRLIGLIVLALVGFYVAWPAWSGYRIAAALTNEDEALLESKVDFASVRESLKPVVTAEIGKGIDKNAGALGPMAQVLKAKMNGAVIDQVLARTVTPRMMIRLSKDGGDIAASVQKAMADAGGQMGGLPSTSDLPTGGLPTGGLPAGGLPAGGLAAAGGIAGVLGQATDAAKAQAAPAPEAPTLQKTPTTSEGRRSFGLGNVKGFHMAGPFGFTVDVARDASQAKADATLGMNFTGGDWKLTRVLPAL